MLNRFAFGPRAGDSEALVARGFSDALSVARELHELGVADYEPEHGASYQKSATQLRGVAFLIKAGLGLRVAWIDLGGWDTHQGQGNADKGRLPTLLDGLGGALAAFKKRLGVLR